MAGRAASRTPLARLPETNRPVHVYSTCAAPTRRRGSRTRCSPSRAEHGFASWRALKAEVERRQHAGVSGVRRRMRQRRSRRGAAAPGGSSLRSRAPALPTRPTGLDRRCTPPPSADASTSSGSCSNTARRSRCPRRRRQHYGAALGGSAGRQGSRARRCWTPAPTSTASATFTRSTSSAGAAFFGAWHGGHHRAWTSKTARVSRLPGRARRAAPYLLGDVRRRAPAHPGGRRAGPVSPRPTHVALRAWPGPGPLRYRVGSATTSSIC